MCRTKTSLDLSARVTVKKKTPPSTYARRYRDMAACVSLSLRMAARRVGTARKGAPLPTLRARFTARTATDESPFLAHCVDLLRCIDSEAIGGIAVAEEWKASDARSGRCGCAKDRHRSAAIVAVGSVTAANTNRTYGRPAQSAALSHDRSRRRARREALRAIRNGRPR